jgi:hypothetical protein
MTNKGKNLPGNRIIVSLYHRTPYFFQMYCETNNNKRFEQVLEFKSAIRSWKFNQEKPLTEHSNNHHEQN